jgi:hypothetical protein
MTHEEIRALLDRQDWASIIPRLTEWARNRLRGRTTTDPRDFKMQAIEKVVANREALGKVSEMLHEGLAGNPLGLGILGQMEEEVMEPREQAAAMGVPAEAVYGGKRRVQTQIEHARAKFAVEGSVAAGLPAEVVRALTEARAKLARRGAIGRFG